MIEESIVHEGVFVKKRKIFKKKEGVGKKADILEQLETSTITVNNLTFDADEDAQNRIMRAIFVMEHNNVPTLKWKMSNNLIVEVDIETLKDALAAAGTNQSNLWFS